MCLVHDMLELYPNGEMRKIDVFIDQECIQDGFPFQEEFGRNLVNSAVVVPFVSLNALHKMCHPVNSEHLVSQVDNVLVEVSGYVYSLRSCIKFNVVYNVVVSGIGVLSVEEV